MERYIRFVYKVPSEVDVYCTDFDSDIQNRILRAFSDLYPDKRAKSIIPMPNVTEDGKTLHVFKLLVE